jgi:hypothetical protein
VVLAGRTIAPVVGNDTIPVVAMLRAVVAPLLPTFITIESVAPTPIVPQAVPLYPSNPVVVVLNRIIPVDAVGLLAVVLAGRTIAPVVRNETIPDESTLKASTAPLLPTFIEIISVVPTPDVDCSVSLLPAEVPP